MTWLFPNFFQIGPLPANVIAGGYHFGLVILSYVIAVLASYVALDLAGRLREKQQKDYYKWYWLMGGAFAMGAGIWSMHFIGMLAFIMPMPMTYDFLWTSLSMLAAILVSAFALYLLKKEARPLLTMVLGGIFLGLGIATMHYMGMEGMKDHVSIHYLPSLFFLSILIAIVASEAALWLMLQSNKSSFSFSRQFQLKIMSALVMGAAICGMHYTGMAAAIFTPLPMVTHTQNHIPPYILAFYIAGIAGLIIVVALIASTYSQLMSIATRKQEALLLKQKLVTAHHVGMTEVADSVLHNVGNVLNSVNISSSLVSEKIHESKLDRLIKIKEMIQANRDRLGDFITTDPQGIHLPDYLILLADCWKAEKELVLSEMKTLRKNIQHIKDIIDRQQSLGKTANLVEDFSIVDLIEDALIINKTECENASIEIIQNYRAVPNVVLDRVKLLQILVNLIRNSIDALIEKNDSQKQLTIAVKMKDNSFVSVQFIDNGIGIDPKNINKIFSHGFTTKKGGHGFGLHSSALIMSSSGGQLTASSPGVGKGATFELLLPTQHNLIHP